MVDFEGLTYPLRLLVLVNRGGYAAGWARDLGVSRQSVQKGLERLKNKGFVSRRQRNESVEWRVTSAGKELLKAGVGTSSARLTNAPRLHHLIFRFPVLEGDLSGWSELEWRQLGFEPKKEGFLKAFSILLPERGRLAWVGKSFLFYCRPVCGKTDLEALENALKLAEEVAAFVGKAFSRVKIHARAELCRQHLARTGGVANYFPKPFYRQGTRVLIDFSTGIPEVETFGAWSVDGARNVHAFLDFVAGLSDAELARLTVGSVARSFEGVGYE